MTDMDTKLDLELRCKKLETALNAYGATGKVVNVYQGPTATRYEIKLELGVRISRVRDLEADIAMVMSAKSIRMEAPVPGKSVVAIEIENERKKTVRLGEIMDSQTYADANTLSSIPLPLGIGMDGRPVIADLAKMPHLLIGGCSASGKSVFVHSVITSILRKKNPEEVKLLLVDPKRMELSCYNGASHLIRPVITDPNKAVGTLQWAVTYMAERFDRFHEEGVRDLDAYNEKMREAGRFGEVLPKLVIIVDELADLMMEASNAVEEAIVRLAHLAGAAGIHMILATQRPSVDVITGLIKVYVSSRIAFMVSSGIDSRTIIDMAGAEKLIGQGDMLFKPRDRENAKRIQGSFVSEEEIEEAVEYSKWLRNGADKE